MLLSQKIKLLLLCLLAVTSGMLTACTSTPPPNTPVLENTVRTYLSAIQSNNFKQAYNLSVISYQYPYINEIQDQYTQKITDKKAAQSINSYSINRVAFSENIAVASLRVTSQEKEYNGFLRLVKANINNQEHWLIYDIYPILQSSIPNSLVASAGSEHWKATVHLILSDQPDQTGWAQMTAIQLGYTGNNPVTKFECSKDIPGFTSDTFRGQRSLIEAQLTPQFTATDFSNGSTKINSLKQAEELLRRGKLTVTWQEGNVTKSEEIKFDSYKTILWNTSVPIKQ